MSKLSWDAIRSGILVMLFANILIALPATWFLPHLTDSIFERTDTFWSTLLSVIVVFLSVTFGVIGFLMVWREDRKTKIIVRILTGISIFIIIISIYLFALQEIVLKDEYSCRVKLEHLSQRIKFPFLMDNRFSPENWCDELVNTGEKEEAFKCPLSHNVRCSYAMNPYAKLNSAGNVVLLFESKGGWNQFGGPELLNADNHNGRGCNVVFVDGHAEFVRAKDFDKLLWKSEADLGAQEKLFQIK